MYKLYVVVEVQAGGANLCMTTDVINFECVDEADIAYDKIMETHIESPITRYEVTKLY